MSTGSTKKSKKQARDSDDGNESSIKLTKEETQIARHLRLNCPNKQGNLVGMKVNFFIANKLVDALMDSKWGPGLNPTPANAAKKTPLFANRQACVAFMQLLMNKQLFYRVVKVYKEQPAASSLTSSSSSSSLSTKESNAENATPSTGTTRKRKTKEATPVGGEDTPSASANSQNTPSSQKDANQQQAKRKFKLEMHEVQTFVDANEPYVWIYDPTSTSTYIIGFLLILGSIGICLFPLWPSQVRDGVYYLSIAGISLLGAILGLAVFKYVLFGFIWALTFGKVQFWLFPNLTEDVGFFESFVPVYKIGSQTTTPNKSNKTKKTTTTDDDGVSDLLTKSTTNSTVGGESNEKNESNETKSTTNNSQIEKGSSSNIAASTYELSKSTVDISASTIQHSISDSPLILTKSTRSISNRNNEDEGFELVDDEDLVKSSRSSSDTKSSEEQE